MLETIKIEHSASGTQAHIAPAIGFNCYSFLAAAEGETLELLWHDPELLAGKAKPTRSGIPILFPFAGRILGRKLTFEGRSFELNEPGDQFNNPIHGFVLRRPWRVIEQTPERVVGEFQPSVDEPALVAHWPADYRIRVAYQVADKLLRSEIEIHNPDTKLLPFSFGTHAYFRLPLGKGQPLQCTLTVPARYEWLLNDLLVPTHLLKETPLVGQLEAGLPLADAHLDTLLTSLKFNDHTFATSITDPVNHRQLAVRFGDEFANCVVFIPPHREAVCIEPYTSAPDAFRLQTIGLDARLKLLAPGGTWKSWVEMQLS
jgi:aldose 1-epimerase